MLRHIIVIEFHHHTLSHKTLPSDADDWCRPTAVGSGATTRARLTLRVHLALRPRPSHEPVPQDSRWVWLLF